MPFDVIVGNGTIVSPREEFPADIGITAGRISAVAAPGVLARQDAAEWVDAAGLKVLPGLIDAHVHFYDPGWPEWEDFTSGTRGAAASGLTTIVEMPNSYPSVDRAEIMRSRLQIVEPKAVIDFAMYGGLGETNGGAAAGLAEAGVIGFKSFRSKLPETNERAKLEGGIRVADPGLMLERLRESAATGLVHSVHVEHDALAKYFEAKARAAGQVKPQDHSRGRPELCEVVATGETLALARAAGARLHLVHVASPDAIMLARRAREDGQAVTIESRPEYLHFTDTDMTSFGAYGKVHPPLRSAESQARLWEFVRNGTVDILASDHTPSPSREADRRSDNIFDAAGGQPGMEPMVPMMLTHVNAGRLTLGRLVALLSENPARIFGLYPRKGRVAIGSDADLTIVDMARTHVLRSNDFYTKSRVLTRPYDGRTVTGMAVVTMVRGRVVASGGEVTTRPGYGRFLRP